MKLNLENERILVTGGTGFLGSHLVERLTSKGSTHLVAPRSAEYDLVHRDAVTQLYQDASPTVVIHLAARVGGIGANRANPGKFFHDNLMMGVNLIDEARHLKDFKKFVQVGTVCAYPKFTQVPFREESLWDGYPEETNAPYGIAKKALLVMLQAYRAQYGFPGIFLLPVNLYGPRDNFDLESSHVIPAMIRKMLAAKDTVELWGDGSPSREFLYVDDCAEALALATERYDGHEPINLGSGREITMKELAETIRDATGCTAEIVWNTDMPNGQPRRCLDTSRAEEAFGFRAQTGFKEGLQKTINWWMAQQAS